MGYYTRFSLDITPLKGSQEKEVTFDTLISEGESNQLSQEDMVKYLKMLKETNGKAVKVPVTFETIMKQLREEVENAGYAMEEDGGAAQEMKWYDYKTDIAEFTKKYPDWLFTLQGEGEESGDLWKCYFVNGKVQVSVPRIVYDEFDPTQLVNAKD